jgi:uncharacterized membrane protein (UPF0136 family)
MKPKNWLNDNKIIWGLFWDVMKIYIVSLFLHIAVGGIMGFVKKGSMKSAAAGGLSSLLLCYVYTQLPINPTFASSLGLGKTVLLNIIFFSGNLG